MATAILGGGCFWCLDAVFRRLHGVDRVTCGYAGGAHSAPDYELVCSGTSGHVEVVSIEFRPDLISFRQLLEVFFSIHDPTTVDRQGNDIGSQYASVIFYTDAAQRSEALMLIAELDAGQVFPGSVVTRCEAAPVFHPAESYHQNYYSAHPEQAYCQFVIAPKLAKLRHFLADRLKGD
ncbi:peptide-methionine (S)-S-oxide reductase MsrA [Azonexus fungiphilus]|uniref:peptide-methionine (S)-S-oxide reductase MsrA n=1 Tax=Azonexus fungiphilus TaxID=146940 RepID=UPI00156A838A|nr:peptide-methionine (S)-S-oxide reductase MsrA [Azonexus fungiphilus]NHC06382.1 peptide-methionine (S)-S-oxide reductase MsrA [Azonexus fungiphilus]